MIHREQYKAAFLKTVCRSPEASALAARYEKKLKALVPAFDYLNKASAFFYLFDFTAMRYLYVSESISEITGYTANDWIKGGPEFAFGTVLPEDAGRLKELHVALFNFFYQLPPEKRHEYKYAFEVRVRRKNGTPVWLLQQGSFVEVDDEGRPIISFDVLTDVSQIKKDDAMGLNVFKDATSQSFSLALPATTRASATTTPDFVTGMSEKFGLTPREAAVLALISAGRTSKEIATQLFISVETARNHRKKIMQKTGASNVAELLGSIRSRK